MWIFFRNYFIIIGISLSNKGEKRMNKRYCDLCGKEIKGDNFVSQVITNYKTLEMIESEICLKCWKKEEKSSKEGRK
jgi:hypothetical protein